MQRRPSHVLEFAMQSVELNTAATVASYVAALQAMQPVTHQFLQALLCCSAVLQAQ
jgi:hypothetical protein